MPKQSQVKSISFFQFDSEFKDLDIEVLEGRFQDFSNSIDGENKIFFIEQDLQSTEIEEKEYQKEQNFDSQEIELQQNNRIHSIICAQSNKTNYNYLAQYIQYLWPHENLANPKQIYSSAKQLQNNLCFTQKLEHRLLQHRFFLKCQTYTEDIQIHCFQSTKNSEIVTVQFQLGFYKTSATILNLSSAENQKSHFHTCAINKFGGFGNIYLVQNENQEIAIKCIEKEKPFSHEDSTDEKEKFFVSGLQEWFFLKLFSALKIGPKIKKILGFDLIFGSTCVEFAMEVCSPLSHSIENEKNIKKALKKMHALRIMHRDIKPGNMMWSDEFKRPVFIDFGGTKFIQQSLGYKTYTSFMGTTGYISTEMIHLLHQKNGFADLYYNEIYGLSKSFALLASKRKKEFFKCEKINFMTNFDLLLAMIKSQLYRCRFQKVDFLLKSFRMLFWDELESGQEQLAEFLVELKPSMQLKKVYLQLSGETRAKQKFKKLKNTYSDQLQMIFSTWNKYEFRENKFKNQKTFYSKLYITHGRLSQIQKEIQMILVSKQKILQFIDFISNQRISSFDKDSLMIYSIVSLVCCTLAHDNFNFKIEQKLQFARLFVQKVNLSAKDKNFPKLIFKCPLKQFRDVAYLMQYFLVNIWEHVPEQYKDTVLKYLISSLALVGYPFYAKEANDFAFYFFLRNWSCEKQLENNDFSERMKGIVLFWRCCSLIKVHNKLFSNRQDAKFILDKQKFAQILQQSIQIRMMLMDSKRQPIEQVQKRFIEGNHRIFKSFNQEDSGLNAQLNNKEISQILKGFPKGMKYEIAFKEWRISIMLIMNGLDAENQRELLTFKSHSGKLQNFQKQNLEFGSDIDYSLHFSLFIHYCYKAGNMDRVKKMLAIIDQSIIAPIVCQRAFLEFRIYFAWTDHDIPRMKRLVTVVLQGFDEYSIHNFKLISLYLDMIHGIMKRQRYQMWKNPIPKLIMFYYLQKLINKTQQFIQDSLNQLTHAASINDQNSQGRSLVKQSKENSSQQLSLLRSYLLKMNLILRMVYMYQTDGTYHQRALHILKESIYFKYQVRLPQSQSLMTYLRSKLPPKLHNIIFLSKQATDQLQDFTIFIINRLQALDFAQKNVDNCKQTHRKLQDPQQNLNKYDESKDFSACQNLNIGLKQNQTDIQMINNQILKLRFDDNTFLQNIVCLIQTKSKHWLESIFQNQLHSYQSTMILVFSYYPAKIKINKDSGLENFQRIIDLYHFCTTEQDAFKYLYHFEGIQLLFDAYILCEKSHEQLFTFFLHASSLLTKFPQDTAIDQFQDVMGDKFAPQPRKKFQRKPNNWKPLEFASYIYEQRKRIKPRQNPYMGMVLHAVLRNIQIDTEIRRSLFKLTIRSMQFMKRYVKNHIYLLHMQAFILLPRQKVTLTQTRREICGDSIPKLQFNDQMVRRECYYASKTMKSRYDGSDISWLVDERLRIVRKNGTKQKFPERIEKLYRKKMYQYHQIEKEAMASNYQFESYQKQIDEL